MCELGGGWLVRVCEVAGGWLVHVCELAGGWLVRVCEVAWGFVCMSWLVVQRGRLGACNQPATSIWRAKGRDSRM